MERENITLSLPRDTLRKARHLAVEKGVSVSRLVAECVQRMLEEDAGYEEAMNQAIRRMKRGIDMGTKGKTSYTRDDLHERRIR